MKPHITNYSERDNAREHYILWITRVQQPLEVDRSPKPKPVSKKVKALTDSD